MRLISSLADLTPDPKNARRHTPRNVGAIVDALHEVGAARSIVVDEDGVILAGNATVEAAAEAGIERVQVVETDGNTLVAVRRSGLTPAQKQRLALFDNRAAELAAWEPAQLAAFLEEDEKALDGLFAKDELGALLADLRPPPADDPGPQIDRAEELRSKWATERGQLWAIGRHRLLCGDATDAGDVARLVGDQRLALLATDPPYNVDIDYGENVDDGKLAEVYEAFSRGWFGLWRDNSTRQIVTPGCYNLASWLRWFDAYHVAPWIKTNAMTNGKVARWWCWEPVVFFGSAWTRTRPNDVFDFPVPPQQAAGLGSLTPYHPCPKPLPMWVDLLENYSEPGDAVGDVFVGAGTALVAAEQTGRRGYAMDLEPKYVAVCLERLSGMGLTPRLAD